MLNDSMDMRLVELFENGVIKLGDEIPYKYLDGTYISPEKNNGIVEQCFCTCDVDINWQAIGIEEISGEKCLKILAKDPIFYLLLRGKNGYEYGEREMDNISQLFATGEQALKARNIAISDINQLLGCNIEDYGVIEGKPKNYDMPIYVMEKLRELLNYEQFFIEKKQKKFSYICDIKKIHEKEIEKKIIKSSVYKPYWINSSGELFIERWDFAYCLGLSVCFRDSVAVGIEKLAIFFDDTYNGRKHFETQIGGRYLRPVVYLKPNTTFRTLMKGDDIDRESYIDLLKKLKKMYIDNV